MNPVTMELLRRYALTFVGTPYRWGGDDPMAGFDCSGFAIELLRAVGVWKHGDTTADGLYHYLKAHKVLGGGKLGAFAFYGREGRATHVAFCISDDHILEAGGGGSKTLTIADAITQNAYIRMRPINFRSDLIAICLPDYGGV